MNGAVPIEAPLPTLMMKWGDWFGPISFALGLLCLFGLWLTRRQVSKT
jgi:hypothetical protein